MGTNIIGSITVHFSNKMKKILVIFLLISFPTQAQFIAKDKQLHAAAGFVISSGTYAIVKHTTGSKKKAILWSLITSTSAGIVKEIYDTQNEGTPEFGDALATTAGGALGTLTFYIILDKKRVRKQPDLPEESTFQPF